MTTPDIYLTQQYYGCCGASIIYFSDGLAVNPDKLKRTVDCLERSGYGMLTCTLIPRQAGHKHLVDAGFKVVARTVGRSGNVIRTYIKESRPAKRAEQTPSVDTPRAFGARQ